MYGTIARMRPLPGKFEELRAMGEAWNRERKPQVKGVITSYLMLPDNKPGEAILVAIFADKAAYVANANDPEQDTFYQRMRTLLATDPEWEDGEIVES